MECTPVRNLKLDSKDREALKTIRKAQRNGKMLEVVLPAGVMASIFLGNNSAEAAFNIKSTDWVRFAKSMQAIGPMVRKTIIKVARMQLLRHELSPKQRQFWKNIENGCEGALQ
ncbi:hypothetical protein CK501_08000 [Halovibrio salipaludis]|uniref:Uncharacterized protein n=1 Tax=Halovibrio salipaludis TaxID=2032626 RepID=A0A2A2F459_9GAMM|nr:MULTISPECIES: hypothetical protein [Gammaproteobacteria]KAA8985524.1 hypothetical protein F3089_02345 [Halospina sp. K52047b]PAU80381.1 hypothetical protein CK501_08000 [Halovibrio salipaludis]